MPKALLFIPIILLALPSCDSGFADKSSDNTSSAIVQILPTTPALADPALRTDNFIANEIGSLTMGEVLKIASRNGKWEAFGADLSEIKKGITVTRIEGTDMASITATTVGSLSGKKIVDSII